MAPVDDIKHIPAALTRAGQASSDYDLNPEITLPANRKLRPAAVLVALIPGQTGTRVLLTKRAASMVHHPGQIAFAGGKQDADDSGPIDAALREAHEEVGLAPDNVEVLGTLPAHETVTGFNVTPVVARIIRPFTPRPDPGEVAEVFSVPLSHVTDLARFQVQSRIWNGTTRYYQTVPYGPYYIWGATARILQGFARVLAA